MPFRGAKKGVGLLILVLEEALWEADVKAWKLNPEPLTVYTKDRIPVSSTKCTSTRERADGYCKWTVGTHYQLLKDISSVNLVEFDNELQLLEKLVGL